MTIIASAHGVRQGGDGCDCSWRITSVYSFPDGVCTGLEVVVKTSLRAKEPLNFHADSVTLTMHIVDRDPSSN
jgi:hypothetical protein